VLGLGVLARMCYLLVGFQDCQRGVIPSSRAGMLVVILSALNWCCYLLVALDVASSLLFVFLQGRVGGAFVSPCFALVNYVPP
jgi:uncharacterized membrane protein YuzA (DUF378 family)